MKARMQLVLAPLAALFANLALGAAPAAGKVWIVDDGGGAGVDFTEVQSAVDACADGDVIVVRAGSYGATTLTSRSLTLVAEAGEEPVLGGLTIRTTPLGGTVVVRGLKVVGAPQKPGTTVDANTGLVWLEDFTTKGVPGGDIRGANRDVVAIRARFEGHLGELPDFFGIGHVGSPGSGLFVSGPLGVPSLSLFLQDCTVQGGSGAGSQTVEYSGQSGAPGFGAAFFLPPSYEIVAAGCSFYGGHGGSGYSFTCTPFSPPGCTPDCTSAGQGGTGFAAAGLLYEQDCVYVGGLAGLATPPCNPPQPGAPKVFTGTEILLPGPLRTYEVSSPVREGQTIQLAFQGVPGDLAYLLFHTAFDPFYLGPCQGSILPSLAPGLVVIFAGAVDASGALNVAIQAPALGPGVESLTAATQANLVSPDIACHTTTGSAFVLLDSAF